MEVSMRLIAQIPADFQWDGIGWLVLEEDRCDTRGAFLYFHKSLAEESEYDNWYENIEKAQTDAESRWGISKHDWISEV